MQAAWPTTTTVNSAITGLGFTIPTNVSLTIELAAAIRTWESAVGVTPWFVATDTATSTYRTSPTGGDRVFIPPFATVTEVAQYGTAFDSDLYDTCPSLASAQYKPITYIKFQNNIVGDAESITVTGIKGYQTSIFDDVYQLVLDLTVANVYKKAQMAAVAASGASGPITEVRQADVTVKYGSGGSSSSSFTDDINTRLKDLAARYRIKSF